ncbi:M28 family metallopeptidase [Sphingomonas donggukensis]|uniref:M28 family metallopeptidase n=1 Tax=Sphingomonas donggukensis TaxID=2949093 RepID=A0ABY4TYH5_9SPHN|nr:M28 family metallopeptidase [Sphingomonas donggukensis]URW75358.1 M28 family metallopeptidase [Sphingomonas donggukensis]
MRRIATILLAATAVPAAAQTAAPAPVIRPEEMRAHVAFLADDLLEGRDAGTRGYDIAAKYVASRFDGFGLKPGGDAGGWYQSIAFQKARLDPTKPAALTIGGRRFDNGGDVAILPDGRFQDQRLSADAVFVGYGIDAAAQGFDDYRGLDVRGKFVVVLPGVPTGTPSEIGASLSAEKAKMAERRGAIGILTLPTPTMLKQFPWERARASVGAARQRVVEPDGTVRLPAPGIKASAYVHGPAADALFAGSGTTPAKVFAAAAKKNARPRGFALVPALELAQSSLVEKSRSPNVVGVLPGSDPKLRDEYVLLTAHLDHNGVNPAAKGEDKVFNGAMDNAAGVATMLEAARAFVASGQAPRRSVMFVALTSEEDGLLGSDYLARHPAVPRGASVVADVNLDMPVLLYKLDDVVAFGAEHSTVGEAVARAAARTGIALSPDFMPEENVFVRSDHYSFVKQGVPSVMLATGSKNDGARIFKEFLGKTYHTPADQPSLPFDWVSAAKFATVNYEVARDLADAPERPRWYVGSPFGEQFAKDQPKAVRPK